MKKFECTGGDRVGRSATPNCETAKSNLLERETEDAVVVRREFGLGARVSRASEREHALRAHFQARGGSSLYTDCRAGISIAKRRNTTSFATLPYWTQHVLRPEPAVDKSEPAPSSCKQIEASVPAAASSIAVLDRVPAHSWNECQRTLRTSASALLERVPAHSWT
eukprot:422913-Pleurochrysis_carterae.AAC.1